MRLNFTLITVFILAFRASPALSQSFKNDEVRSILDSTLSVMKNNAINTNKVNWKVLKQSAYIQASNVKSPSDLGNVIRTLFKTIDDSHGKFFYRDSIFQWLGNYNISLISDSVKNEWEKRSGIKTAIIDNNIGYLRIPSIIGDGRADYDREAQKLNDSLCVLLAKNIKGIVLDLRINGGGAMFPMILGLKQLLGDGKLGEFRVKLKKEDWALVNNAFKLDTNTMASINPKYNIKAETIPCVLLIGPGTGSSGEFLIMAFKGRKNTVLLGTNTVGAVTVLNGFQVTKSAFINLAVGYGRDRNGIDYTKPLTPDIILNKTDHFNDLKKDEKVRAAVQWINSRR